MCELIFRGAVLGIPLQMLLFVVVIEYFVKYAAIAIQDVNCKQCSSC